MRYKLTPKSDSIYQKRKKETGFHLKTIYKMMCSDQDQIHRCSRTKETLESRDNAERARFMPKNAVPILKDYSELLSTFECKISLSGDSACSTEPGSTKRKYDSEDHRAPQSVEDTISIEESRRFIFFMREQIDRNDNESSFDLHVLIKLRLKLM